MILVKNDIWAIAKLVSLLAESKWFMPDWLIPENLEEKTFSSRQWLRKGYFFFFSGLNIKVHYWEPEEITTERSQLCIGAPSSSLLLPWKLSLSSSGLGQSCHLWNVSSCWTIPFAPRKSLPLQAASFTWCIKSSFSGLEGTKNSSTESTCKVVNRFV